MSKKVNLKLICSIEYLVKTTFYKSKFLLDLCGFVKSWLTWKDIFFANETVIIQRASLSW